MKKHNAEERGLNAIIGILFKQDMYTHTHTLGCWIESSGKTPETGSQEENWEVRGREGGELLSVSLLCLYTTFKGSVCLPATLIHLKNSPGLRGEGDSPRWGSQLPRRLVQKAILNPPLRSFP